jgi:hypothetical protein
MSRLSSPGWFIAVLCALALVLGAMVEAAANLLSLNWS